MQDSEAAHITRLWCRPRFGGWARRIADGSPGLLQFVDFVVVASRPIGGRDTFADGLYLVDSGVSRLRQERWHSVGCGVEAVEAPEFACMGGYAACGASVCSPMSRTLQPCADSTGRSWLVQCPHR